VCGGEVVEKEVEKLVKGGNDVAVLRVRAGVCTKCGERLYDADTHHQIDTVRKNLVEQRHEALRKVGTVYSP
jgi:YgiT-type zinc finger domain-containing protein